MDFLKNDFECELKELFPLTWGEYLAMSKSSTLHNNIQNIFLGTVQILRNEKLADFNPPSRA